MRKRVITGAVGICLLLSIVCNSCSRRNHYEELLESQTDPVFEHPLDEKYATPIILKDGENAYYEGKCQQDLEEIHLNSSRTVRDWPILFSFGAVYRNSLGATAEPRTYIYNKLTRNISHFCVDPLCTHDHETCIWTTADICYVGEQAIVFKSKFGGNLKLYASDLQRKNVWEIYDIPEYWEEDEEQGGWNGTSDSVHVEYIRGDLVYVTCDIYNEGAAATNSLCTIDLNTLEMKTVCEMSDSVQYTSWIGDHVYYINAVDNKVYCADLDFGNPRYLYDGNTIDTYTNRYLVICKTDSESFTESAIVYDLETGNTYDLPKEISADCHISGGYIYYTRYLTEPEMEEDPQRDYYTWSWVYKRKPMNAMTQGAGKIYRVKIGETREECVFQLTYKDVPVRISDIAVDGEVLYISYHHYEQFKNFLNQNFPDSEQGSLEYAIADLQNGTVRVLDFSVID